MENKKVTFVIKSSKLCNLRCRYCYEYAELGNRTSIAPEQLNQMYTHIASYYRQFDYPVEIEFVWHGGEPLLFPPDYYWRTFDNQKRIFSGLSNTIIVNSVQTNLTVLKKEHIRLLRNGFDSVGVSLDLFGGLRIHKNGLNSQPNVLNNMKILSLENIKFGCVTVLTQLNLPYIKEIYNFYETRNISFRLLPLFDGAFDGQHHGYEINHLEILNALRIVFDLWLASKSRVKVQPITEYIQQLIHYYMPNKQPSYYDKRKWESIYLVNVDGNIYSYADAYNPTLTHGNLFTTPLENIVREFMHLKAIESAEKRINSVCTSCSYFGSCTGYPMAEESIGYNQIDEDGRANCTYVKDFMKYIDMRFKQVGIINPITRKLNLKSALSTERQLV